MILFSLWKMRLLGSHQEVTSSTSSMMIPMFPSVFGVRIKPRQPKFELIAHVLDNTDAWINLIAFQAYMNTSHGSFDEYRIRNPTPFGSRAPSRAASSHEESCPSLPQIPPKVPSLNTGTKRCKGKKKAALGIELTREETVDTIVETSTIPSTWPVPRVPTAYLVDMSKAPEIFKVGNRTLTIDRFIRTEDQDSWGGSNGHASGDVNVAGFFPDLTKTDCQRYEPDEAATRELWKHELDANEREAASAPGLISQFYVQIMHSKCKVECDGVPVLK
ncbi:hypothetical protein B0H12DRAFT_1068310 [Mycena haematopus]|nr:hypothetical protein B0H12DRAFT_1068310 [Mycena haematopus]